MPCRPVSATASSTGRDLDDPGLADQAYNTQATVHETQMILAAEIIGTPTTSDT